MIPSISGAYLKALSDVICAFPDGNAEIRVAPKTIEAKIVAFFSLL
jgi:hypothetical protein